MRAQFNASVKVGRKGKVQVDTAVADVPVLDEGGADSGSRSPPITFNVFKRTVSQNLGD